MTPDEKRLLITTHMAKLLKELNTDPILPDTDHFERLAEGVMNGWDEEVKGNQLIHHKALWDIIAPMLDGIQVYKAIDQVLWHHDGEPLTRQLRESIMLDVSRAIAAHSRTSEVVPRQSRSRSTGQVWGGPPPGLTREDLEDISGV